MGAVETTGSHASMVGMKRQRSFRSHIALATITVALTALNAQPLRLAAQSGSCSRSTINRLEAQSDSLQSWLKLQAFYHRYRVCRIDDAEVTEGISESVARMLADHWESAATAQAIFRRDPAFEKFALAGLNITDSTEDLNRISGLATKQCPSGFNGLCQRIRRSIRHNN